MKIRQIHPLTSLRFVFAFMVFLSHLTFMGDSQTAWMKTLYKSVFSQGYIGVGFFFILSGFILTHVYRSKLIGRTPILRDFFIFRIARIYPLHFLTFLVAAPLMLYTATWNEELIWISLSNLSLTQAFIPYSEYFFSYNGVSWSISCEAFFYLCFPLILWLFHRIGTWRYLFFMTLFCLLALGMYHIGSQWHNALFYVHPFTRMLDFMLGILLYAAYDHLSKKSHHKWSSVLEIGAVLVLVLMFSFRESVPPVLLHSVYYWIPMCLILLIFALQGGQLSQWLSSRWCIWLGEISFGFYMWHHLVLRYFQSANRRLLGIENEFFMSAICLVITIVLAGLSYEYFEKPTNHWVRKTFSKKKLPERPSA